MYKSKLNNLWPHPLPFSLHSFLASCIAFLKPLAIETPHNTTHYTLHRMNGICCSASPAALLHIRTRIQFSLTFLLRPTLLRPAPTSSPTLSLLSLHHNTIFVLTHSHSHGDRCPHSFSNFTFLLQSPFLF